MPKYLRRLLPFMILIVLIAIVYLANFHTLFNIKWLREEHLRLQTYAHQHPVISPLIYMGVYILSVCLIIPDSTILTLLGGLIFPLPLAVIYAVLSEGIGAFIFYQILHSAFFPPRLRIKQTLVKQVQKELKSHPASYMLFLRISHVIPFWTTNVIAAYFRVKPKVFAWTTFVGVLPLTLILADAGNSLSEEFDANKALSVSDIFTLQVKLALLVMGLMIIAPLIYRHMIRRKSKS